ncbi:MULTISPECIES: C-GCAxxG-C-C family (seleno)protein [unclassified Fusibacter]|uniref:C-GCAxxG-C-C family (seleno)protein n=1 Tax=unclassified Fusibacter TaxID=2624464 RepID=UPI0010134D0E|nr:MULTISPECIES: C-GCAxxG-C-C family (seleno)protein [unclassified Fusibacter]MCK8061423.1 C-GCAxxG-C-C family protein [Fusibacter sp. A2]NPE23534.1 hypothetical protein [Fusibacter sp. A1]RXV58945.1 C_GCAxxG_C_C family protein [Fusibacter sp. A1]
MSMIESIRKFRQKEFDLSCSEATLYAANESYALQLDEEALKMMAGFSGGIMREDICGVVTGSIAVLSVLFTDGVAHQSPVLKQAVDHYMTSFEAEFGSTSCKVLKGTHRDKVEDSCDPVIFKNAELLNQVIEEYNKNR